MAKAAQPSAEAYSAAAKTLGCSVAAIRAVAQVESGTRGAWRPSGEPTILYEAHYFHRLTKGRFDGVLVTSLPLAVAELSYPKWRPGTYGTIDAQHVKLQAASALDREAALKSCSWGLFQIMGENHRRAGHDTVQSMVNAAYRSVDDHLAMFVNFIRSDPKLLAALRALDWQTFARIYNGPRFAETEYDLKMAAAYAVFAREE